MNIRKWKKKDSEKKIPKRITRNNQMNKSFLYLFWVYLLAIFILVSCQAREYQLLNHQVVGVEGEQGGIMGACVGITNTGPRGPMLPDSAGDRVDDTYFECTEREMMELEHQRHRNKKEDQKEKTK